ncbi:MAG: hypothetical protein ABIG95_01635 [Candidatus Woesearchaeota archaeon]
MSLDDLLAKAIDPAHAQNGRKLQQNVIDGRIMLLMEFFPQTLSEEDREAWGARPWDEKLDLMQKKHYMLKPEHAYQLIHKMAAYVLKKHSPDLAETFEKAVETRYSDEVDEDKKAEADRTIEMMKWVVTNLGFDVENLERHAVEKGFDAGIWNQFTEAISEKYEGLYAKGYLDQAEEKELYTGLDKIRDETGLKVDMVKAKGRPEVINVLASYHRAKRADNVAGFKENYHFYH